ncbi:hypothetical protein D3797_005065 [Bacillus subtilis]|nr:hypothetical protein DKG76_16850 [Bacillus inaquosorum]QJC89935.1 hypothetical protein HC662_31290 [Bacillus subtilis]RKQ25465.1 hypothetical protein D3797_005065 [Bacillus subtilis]
MLDFSLTSHPLPFIMIVVVCENQQQRAEAKKTITWHTERNVLYMIGGASASLQYSCMPYMIRKLILLFF